jgi:hypothetical protein
VASVAVPLRRGVKKNISRNGRNVLQRAQRVLDRLKNYHLKLFKKVSSHEKRGQKCRGKCPSTPAAHAQFGFAWVLRIVILGWID